jgi:hypothetical protein
MPRACCCWLFADSFDEKARPYHRDDINEEAKHWPNESEAVLFSDERRTSLNQFVFI